MLNYLVFNYLGMAFQISIPLAVSRYALFRSTVEFDVRHCVMTRGDSATCPGVVNEQMVRDTALT
jgi:hypothetical protein